MPKFKLLRTITGIPLFILGMVLASITTGWLFWYLIGCVFALMGTYIVSRMVNYTLDGIGFAFVGLPVFFLSMLPEAYQFMGSFFGFESSTIFVIRLVACFIGGLMIFASIHED
jgi:hypothetical protein